MALALYATLAVMAFLTADRRIFLPPRPSYSAGELPVAEVPTGDRATLAVLHLPAPPEGFTLLLSHGNAEDLGHLLPLLRRFQQAGFGVLAWDYRGYGASTGGPPTTRAVLADVETVWRHATDALGIEPSRLVAYGRSVGSGPATWLAARRPVAGLVIESGFTSAFRVVTRWPILPFDRFPNLRHVREVDVPVLVIHGAEDRIIPPSHGRELHAAAPGPKRLVLVEGAGHNDLHAVAGERVLAELRDFTASLQGPEGR